MSKLNLNDFYKEFCKKLENEELKGKYIESRSDFTIYIAKCIGGILSDKFNYNWIYGNWKSEKKQFIQSEYYRIDMTGWTQRKEEIEGYLFEQNINIPNKVKNFNPHFWELDIAIEHENDCSDWLDEVVKLYYINCPLRIVISYVDRKSNGMDEDTKYLRTAVHVLNMLDQAGAKQLIKKDDEFGIVLGSRNLEEVNGNYQLYKIVRDESRNENVYTVIDGSGKVL